MRGPSSLLGLFSVVALLMLGTGGAWANAAEPMPCHEMTGAMNHDAPAPDAPAKAMVMACCVACVAPPMSQPPVGRVAAPRLSAIEPARFDLPVGRSPSPEPGPPKA